MERPWGHGTVHVLTGACFQSGGDMHSFIFPFCPKKMWSLYLLSLVFFWCVFCLFVWSFYCKRISHNAFPRKKRQDFSPVSWNCPSESRRCPWRGGRLRPRSGAAALGLCHLLVTARRCTAGTPRDSPAFPAPALHRHPVIMLPSLQVRDQPRWR